MASIHSKIFNIYIRLIGIKRNGLKIWSDPDRNKKSAEVPKRFYHKFKVEKHIIRGHRVFTILPKNGTRREHILFFHGGAYANEITPFHWRFVRKIATGTQCALSVLEYPLTPEHNHEDTFEMVQEAYQMLANLYTEDQFIFMGDSAGGGLSLSLAQLVQQQSILPKPIKLVLISPWIDVEMTENIPIDLDKKDLILNIDALKMAGLNYAGKRPPNHYLISPINGEFSGLPEVGIWAGTSEIFLVDMPRLIDKLKICNVSFKYYEAKNMQHDYAIFPIPEGNQAVKEICSFIGS